MKKSFIYAAAFAMALACPLTSCSNSDDPQETTSADIDYNSNNSKSWNNYMKQVATLLVQDATSLNDAWTTSYNGGASYATTFKNHNGGEFTSARSCIEQIIDGCSDIANEVGTAKIGDPYSLYIGGKTTQALYAVESWYSWHSRDDYRNNIYSIRNAYYGSLDGTISTKSLSKLIAMKDAELDTKVKNAISDASNAIYAIPQPFRNNIGSTEASNAMTACAALDNVLNNELKAYISNANNIADSEFDEIVSNYVDVVVLPTYNSLKQKNQALLTAVNNIISNPTDENFKNACNAWLEAREPWETSEAFLFGPVDALGLDPNMDSWPLDQDQIVQILNSGKYESLNWTDSDDDDAIESAQSVRGFHTLEFLLFKDGNPRKVQ